MSGAERTSNQIAQDVFHALHPECTAFPGMPNPCDPQVCDCFNCEQLPEKVAEIVAALRAVAYWLRVPKGPPPTVQCERALGRLQDVSIDDIIGGCPREGCLGQWGHKGPCWKADGWLPDHV